MSKTSLTVNEAAIASGKSTKTIYRWIKSGKVSSSKDKDGKQRIDISELSRVVDLSLDMSGQIRTQMSDTENEQSGHVKELEKELEGLKKLLLEKDQRLQEKDHRINELKEDKEMLQLLLEHKKEDKREEKTTQKNLGFFSSKLSKIGL